MKKSLIFKILYLFLGLIVMAGASVFATTTYLASQVSYGNTNVETALNDLYTLKGNDETYSTEEKIVGKWIDGKPIYRKVITYTESTMPANTWTKVASVPNAERIVGHCVVYQWNSGWWDVSRDVYFRCSYRWIMVILYIKRNNYS